MQTAGYNFLVLDIETSTLMDENNSPIATWLAYGYCNLYNRDGNRLENCYFREWQTLDKYLKLKQRQFCGFRLLCFVHNLGYEFDYLIKNLSKPKTMLTNNSHATISAILEDYLQIEFRCTYKLSGYSLEKIGEQLNFPKLDSEYRYIIPSDVITEKEKEYCIRDCDVVAKYISETLKEYAKLNKIPYTKTGRVRKIFYEYYKEVFDKEKTKWDLMPDEDCYQALLGAFNGGAVFSNTFLTCRKLKNVHSYDITSSYPYAMLKEIYPSKITRLYGCDRRDLKGFFIAKIKFYNIQSKYPWNWLSNYKFDDYDAKTSNFFNGKLIETNWCIRTVTNIDFELIKQTYDFDIDKIEVLEFYKLENLEHLPYPYIETIKYCAKRKYELKIKLKDVKKNYGENSKEYKEIEYEYLLAKNDFNSIYGMSVQKLMNPDYYIDEMYRWHEKKVKYVQNPRKHMKRNFLFGIFITAYARRNLIKAILKNCPYTFVYCDTDSIKFIGKNEFIDTNEKLDDEFLQYEYLKDLGKFDYEGTYEKFITFGAKKYCYQNGSETHITVAGLPKYQKENSIMELWYNGEKIDGLTETKDLKSIEYFRCGTLFKNCKLAKKYISSNYNYILDEFNELVCFEETDARGLKYMLNNNIKSNGGVALFHTDYLLNITPTDRFYILEIERVFKKWAKTHLNGITCEEYLNMTLSIE